jgi:hypothetical protein
MEVPAYDGAKVLTDKTPGTVLQVTQTSTVTGFTITSTTPTTILTATITPRFATSKILVMAVVGSVGKGASSAEGLFRLLRGGSVLASLDGVAPYTSTTTPNSSGSVVGNYLDSPTTTSVQTYSLDVASNGNPLNVNWEGGHTSITLMEIAA